MSWPSAASFCAIVSSDRIAPASSASISALFRLLTASADTAPSPSVAAMPEDEQYLSSNQQRAPARYLLLVTRVTVQSSMPMTVPTVRRVKPSICTPPVRHGQRLEEGIREYVRV